MKTNAPSLLLADPYLSRTADYTGGRDPIGQACCFSTLASTHTPHPVSCFLFIVLLDSEPTEMLHERNKWHLTVTIVSCHSLS